MFCKTAYLAVAACKTRLEYRLKRFNLRVVSDRGCRPNRQSWHGLRLASASLPMTCRTTPSRSCCAACSLTPSTPLPTSSTPPWPYLVICTAIDLPTSSTPSWPYLVICTAIGKMRFIMHMLSIDETVFSFNVYSLLRCVSPLLFLS